MDDDDLPILGEPAPVELANSLYLDEGEAFDFLASDALARRWFEVAELGVGMWPRRSKPGDHARLLALRDAVADLLDAAQKQAAPSAAAVDEVNACARLAPAVPQLVWTGKGPPGAEVRFAARGVPGLLAQLAVAAIELLSGADAGRLRRCEGPGCSLLFVQHHRRRRFCHESCSHRARQMRYYRRTKETS